MPLGVYRPSHLLSPISGTVLHDESVCVVQRLIVPFIIPSIRFPEGHTDKLSAKSVGAPLLSLSIYLHLPWTTTRCRLNFCSNASAFAHSIVSWNLVSSQLWKITQLGPRLHCDDLLHNAPTSVYASHAFTIDCLFLLSPRQPVGPASQSKQLKLG